MTVSKPLVHGYVRALPGLTSQEIDHLRGDIDTFAFREGFALPQVFIEHTWTRVSAWEALDNACRRDQVRDVIVPSWDHLNKVYSLSFIAQKVLQDAIGGHVWFVSTDTEAPSWQLTTSQNGGQP
jgi:hypothetical protein